MQIVQLNKIYTHRVRIQRKKTHSKTIEQYNKRNNRKLFTHEMTWYEMYTVHMCADACVFECTNRSP